MTGCTPLPIAMLGNQSMYEYQDIQIVHLELTSKCNLSCPQCQRNECGGKPNPLLPLGELSLSDCHKIFPAEFLQQLKLIYVCGVYGDGILAHDCLEIFKYFRSENPSLKLQLHTHGSARPVGWWRELASALGEYGNVIFGIDGLEDTNHLYRRGSNWNRVMENAHAFIESGGIAYWQFIAFKHNEHQIESARTLSENMGFKKFTLLNSNRRFFDGSNFMPTKSLGVLKSDGTFDYDIRPTSESDPEYANDFKSLTSKEDYLENTPITCKVQKELNITITFEGLVYPCCWLSSHKYDAGMRSREDIQRLIGSCENIDATRKPISDIVVWFAQIPDLWKPGPSRLKICSRFCGEFLNKRPSKSLELHV